MTDVFTYIQRSSSHMSHGTRQTWFRRSCHSNPRTPPQQKYHQLYPEEQMERVLRLAMRRTDCVPREEHCVTSAIYATSAWDHGAALGGEMGGGGSEFSRHAWAGQERVLRRCFTSGVPVNLLQYTTVHTVVFVFVEEAVPESIGPACVVKTWSQMFPALDILSESGKRTGLAACGKPKSVAPAS